MAKKKQLAAIIHLGSERVTMQLIEYTDLYAVTILDEASQTVRLGEETFKTGRISTETMRALIDILKGFRRLMKDYGIKDYVLEATTAVREARNRTFFLDQVLVKTGFVMDVINLPQEIFRKIASLSYHLESHKKKVEHKGGDRKSTRLISCGSIERSHGLYLCAQGRDGISAEPACGADPYEGILHAQ